MGFDVTVLDNLSSGYEKNLEKVKDKIKLVKENVIYSLSTNVLPYIRGQDVMFHLAAIPDPSSCDKHIDEAFKSNVEGTFNLLLSAIKNGINRVIFLSPVHVYGVN